MNREEAIRLLEEWVTNQGLRRHCLTVEQVMRVAADRRGETSDQIERWGIAGLLHDADWERWPEEHPGRIVDYIRQTGDDEVADAIAAHGVHWGVPHVTPMSKMLVASDELTGLIVACTLLRPDGIRTLDVAGVMKKFKTPKFAAGVNRDEVIEGVAILGVSLEEHIAFILEALKENADGLGLVPST
jgi:predicted hydrolase (HD superfamily)